MGENRAQAGEKSFLCLQIAGGISRTERVNVYFTAPRAPICPMAQYSGSRTEEPPIQCKGWKKISSSVFTHTNRWVPAKWNYVRIQQDLSLLSTFFFLLSIWWAFTAVHALGWVGLVREDIVQHVSFYFYKAFSVFCTGFDCVQR